MRHMHKYSTDNLWVGSSAISLLGAQMSIIADAVVDKPDMGGGLVNFLVNQQVWGWPTSERLRPDLQ